MAQKFDNLSALDWDDTALIKAYDEAMALRDNKLENTTKQENRKENPKKRHEWRVGDFCRAIYYGDELLYEAKIITINGDTCIVEFLGYDEEVEVELDALFKSHGKKARKKQLKSASHVDSSMSESADETRNNRSASQSPAHNHSKRKHHRNFRGHSSYNYVPDYVANDTTYNEHPVVHYNKFPPTSMIPPAPPMPQCSEVAKNPSLCAMLTSWYMAGYYTGLHQARRDQCQRCCCKSAQNCCH